MGRDKTEIWYVIRNVDYQTPPKKYACTMYHTRTGALTLNSTGEQLGLFCFFQYFAYAYSRYVLVIIIWRSGHPPIIHVTVIMFSHPLTEILNASWASFGASQASR